MECRVPIDIFHMDIIGGGGVVAVGDDIAVINKMFPLIAAFCQGGQASGMLCKQRLRLAVWLLS